MAFTDEQKMHFTILGKRVGGKLDCWKAIETYSGDTVVSGYSSDDDWWDVGENVTTSCIPDFDPTKDYVVTNNTVYELGRPFDEFTKDEQAKFHMASRGTRYGM